MTQTLPSVPWLRALRHDPSSYFSSVNSDVLGCILWYMNTMPGAVDMEALSPAIPPFAAFCDPRRPPEIINASMYEWTSIDVDNNGNYAALAVSPVSPHAVLAFCSPTGKQIGHTITLTYKQPGTDNDDDQATLFARTLAIDRRTGTIALCAYRESIVQLRSADGMRVITTRNFKEDTGDVFSSHCRAHISSVTFDPYDSTLVVCDFGAGRLLFYTLDGQHVRTICLDMSVSPTDVAVCPRSGDYVVQDYTGKFSVISRITGKRLRTLDCARENHPLYGHLVFKVDSNDNLVLWRKNNRNRICICATSGEYAGIWRVRSFIDSVAPSNLDMDDDVISFLTPQYCSVLDAMSKSSAFVITPHGDVALLTTHCDKLPLITLLKHN